MNAASHWLLSPLALFSPAFRAELGTAFNLGAAFGAELLTLDRLAAFTTELGVGRNADATIRARADDRLLEFLLGHIGGLLRYLARLLHRSVRLCRRILGFQVRRAVQS